MSERVGPAARRRDLIALLILAGGAITAAYGYVGLHAMASRPIVREAGQTAMERAISYNDVVRTGWVIIAAGVLAVVWSFWKNRAARTPD